MTPNAPSRRMLIGAAAETRIRHLLRSDPGELGPVQPATPFDALAESVGVHVREPDHRGRRRNDRDELARREMLDRAGRQGGHREHRPIHGCGDPTIAAADNDSE